MTHQQQAMALWVGPNGIAIPPSVQTPSEIVPYAASLKKPEQQRVVQALESGLYDMGAEFVWRRAMARLRTTVAALGMEFIGEMLGRDDVDAASSVETVLTDFDTIHLSEALGVISATGALRLRHAFELLAHFAGGQSPDELSMTDAIMIIRACVQYALGEENVQVAVDFSRFRERLLSETLRQTDPQLEALAAQPPFYLSTAVRVLLAAIKTEHGARLQHALTNLTTVLPPIWPRLPEPDRWSVGQSYAEATSSGNEPVVAELKRALIRVAGFDYVPENLRSAAYKRAAQAVLQAHFNFGNFSAEIQPTRHLASLGTVIPKPAVPEAVRALLLVYIGNFYGHSYEAAPIAHQELVRVAAATWHYYFGVVLPTDDDVLQALAQTKPSERFVNLLPAINVAQDLSVPAPVDRLLSAARQQNALGVRSASNGLLGAFRGTAAASA